MFGFSFGVAPNSVWGVLCKNLSAIVQANKFDYFSIFFFHFLFQLVSPFVLYTMSPSLSPSLYTVHSAHYKPFNRKTRTREHYNLTKSRVKHNFLKQNSDTFWLFSFLQISLSGEHSLSHIQQLIQPKFLVAILESYWCGIYNLWSKFTFWIWVRIWFIL